MGHLTPHILTILFTGKVGELDYHRLGRAYVFLSKACPLIPIHRLIWLSNRAQMQSTKSMPYINRPYKNRSAFMNRISRYIDPVEDSPPMTDFVVELAPFPTRFLPSGQAIFPVTHRKESKRIQTMDIFPQTVVYATGYTCVRPSIDKRWKNHAEGFNFGSQKFDFLESGYPALNETDVRNVCKRGDESIAFIGFVRPGVGTCFSLG